MADDDRELMANITPFGLRMQPDLKERVAKSAKANNRSMNAEIVSRLEDDRPPEMAIARDLVERLLRSLPLSDTDYFRESTVREASLFLAGAPIRDIREFPRWSAHGAKVAEGFSTEETREWVRALIEENVQKSLSEIVDYMERQGWEVKPPAPD